MIKALRWPALAVLVFSSAVLWAFGGPAEAWAIVRLDGAEAIPLTPFGLRTCYAPGFTHAGFVAIEPGDTMESVRVRIGPPLRIHWTNGSGADGIRVVQFERQGERYVVAGADGVDVARGASMESVASLRGELQESSWRYARQCTYIDSNRVRDVYFDAGRVTRRYSGVYHD